MPRPELRETLGRVLALVDQSAEMAIADGWLGLEEGRQSDLRAQAKFHALPGLPIPAAGSPKLATGT